MAAVFLAPLYILVNLYIFRWIYLWAAVCFPFFENPAIRLCLIILYLVASTSLLTGFLVKKPLLLRRLLNAAGKFFLGAFMYILIIVFMTDAGRVILKYGIKLSWTQTKESFILTGTACFLSVLLLCLYGFIHASRIKTKNYHVTIHKSVPGMDSLKIILIADCHFGFCSGLNHARKIVEKINEQQADLVCIAGDIFDNEYDAVFCPDELQAVLKTIQSTYGVYACWGNHDLSEPILAGFTFRRNSSDIEDPRMESFLKNSGIQLLKEKAELIHNSFYLVGREDPDRSEKLGSHRKTPAQLINKLDRGKPVIVLDHQPKELKELSEAGADLDLCGHTHDGQIFPGNLFTRLFWENSCGYLQKGSMHNIVTSGAGIWGPAMRIGTDSEICVIHVSFNPAEEYHPDPEARKRPFSDNRPD